MDADDRLGIVKARLCVYELRRFAARRARREAQWHRLHPYLGRALTIQDLAPMRKVLGNRYGWQTILEMHRERQRWQSKRR